MTYTGPTNAHTPGWWRAEYADGFYIEAEVDGEHVGLADVAREADARLMAAAPDLLDALDRMLHVYGEDDEDPTSASGEARAAIEKATVS